LVRGSDGPCQTTYNAAVMCNIIRHRWLAADADSSSPDEGVSCQRNSMTPDWGSLCASTLTATSRPVPDAKVRCAVRGWPPAALARPTSAITRWLSYAAKIVTIGRTHTRRGRVPQQLARGPVGVHHHPVPISDHVSGRRGTEQRLVARIQPIKFQPSGAELLVLDPQLLLGGQQHLGDQRQLVQQLANLAALTRAGRCGASCAGLVGADLLEEPFQLNLRRHRITYIPGRRATPDLAYSYRSLRPQQPRRNSQLRRTTHPPTDRQASAVERHRHRSAGHPTLGM